MNSDVLTLECKGGQGIYLSQQANARQRQHLCWDKLLPGKTMCIPIFITPFNEPGVAFLSVVLSP